MITKKEIEQVKHALMLSTELKQHQTDERFIAGRKEGIEAFANVLILDTEDCSEFEEELERLIDKHSMENASNTSDWILARYLMECMKAFNTTFQQREDFV